jgi:hypothetical protein
MHNLTNEELLRKINILEARTADLEQIENQTTHVVPRVVHEAAEWEGMVKSLPGLRGYWTMNSLAQPASVNEWRSSAGDAMDLDLIGSVPAGTGEYSFGSTWGRNVGAITGGSHHFTRADSAQFDITGTENNVHVTNRGLSLGGIVRLSNISYTNSRGWAGKWGGGTQKSYLVYFNGSGTNKFAFAASQDGSTSIYCTNSRTAVLNEWIFFLAEFDAYDTDMRLRINGTTATQTSGPSSLFNSTANFDIGTFMNSSSLRYNGVFTNIFLCSAAINAHRNWGGELYALAKLIVPMTD